MKIERLGGYDDIALAPAAQIVAEAWARAWQLPLRMHVSEWADLHPKVVAQAVHDLAQRWVPVGAPLPGLGP